MALHNGLTSLTSYVRLHPATVAATVAGVSLVPILPYAYRNYQIWLSMGQGGIPHNIFGWMVQAAIQLFVPRDTLSPASFRQPENIKRYAPHGETSFLDLDDLPVRSGRRPTVPDTVAPQRQLTDAGPPAIRDEMEVYLRAVVAANPDVLVIRPSGMEGVGTAALWPADASLVPAFMGHTKGEIVHAHPEASSHATLSLVDAEEVVRKGWGQRHRMSGNFGFVPLSYLLLYSPRDEEELGIWKHLVIASVRFVLAGGPAINSP